MYVIYEVLETAKTYLDHADQLIYSYAGKTFFGGYALYDPEFHNRGNIDCSTYMHLVMQGISYEESPYATGWRESAFQPRTAWAQTQFLQELRDDTEKRRAFGIAKYFDGVGKTFTDRNMLQPGDLVFYRAPEEQLPYYIGAGAFLGISHIGMASEDTNYIFHATGLPEKEEGEREGLAAVQYTHILDGRTPILFARPW